MTRWRWQAYDLKTQTPAGTLTVESWEHEDRISDAGPFTAELVSKGATLDRQAIAATLPARTTIVPVRAGKLLGFEGVVWSTDLPSVSGAGLLSFFDDQTYDTTRVFVGVDQHLMLKELVDWVQANRGGIQLDTSQVVASGVLRDQTWNVWEQKNVGEAIRQKGDNIGGYDFDFRVELSDAGLPVRRMRMWTPRRGRPYIAGASPVFMAGRVGNVRSVPSLPANGAALVTEVVAIGEEINPTTKERLVARKIRTDLQAAGYPRLVHVLDRNDIKDLVSLQAQADGYARLHGAVELDELVLDVDPDDVTWPWGSWDLGDDCMVVIPPAERARIEVTSPVPAHIWFPGTATNYARVPITTPVDAAFDVRVEFERPPNPPAGREYRWTDTPFYMRSTPPGIQFTFVASDNTFPAATSTWASLEAAGIPAAGEWMQTRQTWDPVTDTLTGYWRAANLPLDDDTGWIQAAQAVHAGKQIRTIDTLWNLGGTTAALSMLGKVSLWWLAYNGTLHREVNMATDLPANLNASTFTCATGQTVTVFRTSAPATKLVPYQPGSQRTLAAGWGVPWLPDGFQGVRRIVAHRWRVDADGERLHVVTGKPLP